MDPNEILGFVGLIVAGFFAGIINTIAGGGSFLTLPALMMFGLPPNIANATNRVAVLFSSGSAVATFYRRGYLDRKLANKLTLPTILGVPVGALLVVKLPPAAFEPLFGFIFLAMAGVLMMNPKRILQAPEQSANVTWRVTLTFFAIGVYVGFIQAGMGLLVLIAMSLFHAGDLVASNAIKNWIALFVTLTATIVFSFYGLIEWLPGLVMAVGNFVGGIVGAKLAISKGKRLIFGVLVTVMIATGLKLIVSAIMG